MSETAEKNKEGKTEIILPTEKHEDNRAVPAEAGQAQGQSLIHAIERVAMNPNADIAKMEKLMEMHRDYQDREAERAFDRDMSLCQGEMIPVVKTAENKQTSSKYAKLDHICIAINPIYSKYGFSVTSKTAKSELPEHFLTITQIRHREGHKEVIELDLPIDNKGIAGKVNKTGVHGVASTISYARRYSICMGFNVATGDDNDGNQTQQNTEPQTITEKQVKELEDLIDKSGTTAKSVCEQAGIATLSELRSEHFGPAKNHILECTEEA